MGLRIVLWYAPKEIQCPTHGRVQEEIPWAPAYARVTYRLEWRLCTLCQIMTQEGCGRDPADADLDPVGGELLLSPQSVEIIKFGDPGSGR